MDLQLFIMHHYLRIISYPSTVGQISNSVTNAANYVSESIQGTSAEASKGKKYNLDSTSKVRSDDPHDFLTDTKCRGKQAAS